jgi:hypothetical protein
MPRRLTVAALSVAIVVLASANAAAQSADKGCDVACIDASIASVATGGAWENGGDHGVFRVVIVNHGWEHVSSDVVVQRIREDADRQELSVVSSRRVADIPSAAGWSMGMPAFSFTAGHTEVRIGATNARTGQRRAFNLLLDANGGYTLVRDARR